MVSDRRSSIGSTANATASSAARPIEARLIRPRAPKQPHGAPARPLISAAACAPVNAANRPAAAYSAPVAPAATPIASPASSAPSAAQAMLASVSSRMP